MEHVLLVVQGAVALQQLALRIDFELQLVSFEHQEVDDALTRIQFLLCSLRALSDLFFLLGDLQKGMVQVFVLLHFIGDLLQQIVPLGRCLLDIVR